MGGGLGIVSQARPTPRSGSGSRDYSGGIQLLTGVANTQYFGTSIRVEPAEMRQGPGISTTSVQNVQPQCQPDVTPAEPGGGACHGKSTPAERLLSLLLDFHYM